MDPRENKQFFASYGVCKCGVTMKNQYSSLVEGYDQAVQTESSLEIVRQEIIKPAGISNKTKGILDIGCANGAYLKAIKKFYPKVFPIVGIDDSKEMIALAKKQSEGIKFYTADMNNLPFKNAHFEVVFSKHAVHYTDSLDKTFSEVARITRHGGIFLFIVSHPIHGLFLKSSHDYGRKENTHFPSHWDKSVIIDHPTFTLTDYVNSIINNGWQIISIFEGFGREATTFKPYRIPTNIQFKLRRS